jgi:quercetin dioxygenase-like cupin family protein
VIAVAALLAVGSVVARINLAPAGPSVGGSRVLANEPVQAMPQGVAFFSIVELPQPPGAQLGPHAHVPGFAYSLAGTETIHFDDGNTIRVGPGEAGFMATQAAHTHLNSDDIVSAAGVAVLIVVLAVWLVWLRGGARAGGRLLPVALVLLIAAGALGTWNPWSNDWLFLSVRPVAARGAPMPIPTASRAYESPDIAALPAGPYVETLEEITVTPGGAGADVGSAAASVLFVLDGRIEVQPATGPSTQVGARGATLIQPGTVVRVADVGDRPAHLLKFAVTAGQPLA